MREDYTPSEKYRNMFGVERNGYGCERVDLYLAQLEVAFKKIREDNRNLKRDLAGQGLVPSAPAEQAQGFSMFPPESELNTQLEQQGQYIMQLQAQLAEQQERARHLQGQLAQAIQAAQAAQLQQPSMQQPADAEALLAQLAALRSEADALRQQLRQQPAVPAMPAAPAVQLGEEEQQGLIGKVLVEARAQAEEMVRAARQESETMMRRARQKVDELRAEQERVTNQLQGISYGLRSVLRESTGAEYQPQQRGEEYAAAS